MSSFPRGGSFTRAVLVLMLLAANVYATGICENTPRKVNAPRFVHEGDGLMAVPVTQAWCEETQASECKHMSDDCDLTEESRGVVSFVEVRDAKGGVNAVLSAARGASAKRVARLVPNVEFVKSIDATLKSRGFVPIVTRSRSCRVRTSWAQRKDSELAFPEGMLGLQLVAGKQTLARVEVGLATSERRDEVLATAHFARSGVLVFARLPICNGIAPGLFDPDDPGECYPEDRAFIHVFDASTLAACFPPS